ncbi:Cyclase-associated protein 1 [Striga hermonthica]|uniref:Cyclase-associated protein 1 n=1 Tax=Striga hermonthica TaxID=68872 RepID=A0A9N7RFC9_STRHE|nr:Cyclase-associated protein 1 [Striga hermonthica]
MDVNLVRRLEAAVARLEAAEDEGGDAFAADPSIAALDDVISQSVGRVTSAAEKIGGQVMDVSNVISEAFNVQSGILGFCDVLISKDAIDEGRRTDFFIHLKTGADSLAALAWIAYTGKDCGMSMPIAHVEECWQTAEFYCNKVGF